MRPDDETGEVLAASADLPLFVEELLTRLGDLGRSGGDPVLVGELWQQALDLMRR